MYRWLIGGEDNEPFFLFSIHAGAILDTELRARVWFEAANTITDTHFRLLDHEIHNLGCLLHVFNKLSVPRLWRLEDSPNEQFCTACSFKQSKDVL
jgi:hypothetical protein